MNRETLVQALHATTVASDQKQAGELLDQCTKLGGFAPELLKIACDANLNAAIRQAAVIYFKNCIVKFWDVEEDDECYKKEHGDFRLLEQDKELIKANILEAICIAQDNTRPQLCVAAQQIMRTEFPEKWPNFISDVNQKLHTPDASALQGALLLIYRMSKIYEYKRALERKPLVDTMIMLLPVMERHFAQLAPNPSQESVTIQRLILKIFYSLVQFSLNTDMIPKASMDTWLEFSRQVLGRPVPDEVNEVEDPEERAHMVWWKCKKWAAKILDRVFERYGAPGQVENAYAEFATHFLEHFSIPCVEAMLHILDEKRQGIYVSDRVLHLALSFLNTSISHSHTWKTIKPHAQEMITTVLYPILCHSDEDEELWEDDVEEYVRFKYDIFEDMHNPSYAAGSLICALAKRKDVIHPILAFAIKIMSTSQDPRKIDGALRLLGELAPQLVKSKKYKKDVEMLLDAHVISRLQDASRFVRARAGWCIKQYTGAIFSTNKILKKTVERLVHCLSDPKEELPAKVESAIAIQSLLEDQEKAHDLVQPYVADVIPKVLELAAQTQIEDVVGVMDALMEQFIDEVVPIAANIAAQMSNMFLQILDSEFADDRTPALMSIITTLSTVLEVVSDHREIMVQMEVSVLRIVERIFTTNNIDFYDEVMLLIQSLISTYVSEPMWKVFDMIYSIVKTDLGIIMFSDVLPVLHLYVVTDTESFLARPDRLNAVIDMCKSVLDDNEQGDENQLHAAKLLEVVILQCPGTINEAIPAIVAISLERLIKPFEDGLSELKHMLLLVVIAALYTNRELAVQILKELAPNHPNPLDYLTEQLTLMSDQFEGVHNRRMAVLAWCTLLQLPAQFRPTSINYDPKKAIECCLTIFKGLQRALKAQADQRKAEMESDSEEDSDEEEEDHRKIDEDLSDGDDEIDEGTLEYLASLAKENKHAKVMAAAADGDGADLESDSDDDDYSMFEDETDTEVFTSLIDEEDAQDVFVAFKTVMEQFKNSEATLFTQMISNLTAAQTKELHELDQICENHLKLEQSKKLKDAGGYAFNSEVVPGEFNFGK